MYYEDSSWFSLLSTTYSASSRAVFSNKAASDMCFYKWRDVTKEVRSEWLTTQALYQWLANFPKDAFPMCPRGIFKTSLVVPIGADFSLTLIDTACGAHDSSPEFSLQVQSTVSSQGALFFFALNYPRVSRVPEPGSKYAADQSLTSV